jgi:hypothetical protein
MDKSDLIQSLYWISWMFGVMPYILIVSLISLFVWSTKEAKRQADRESYIWQKGNGTVITLRKGAGR